MNTSQMGLGFVAILVAASLHVSVAQDTSETTRYVTGCIQKGHDADEYDLIAENARWHLKSDNVRLPDHVGQRVKIAGVVSNQPFHGMKEDIKAEMKQNPTETGVLTVTNLEVVSDSCK